MTSIYKAISSPHDHSELFCEFVSKSAELKIFLNLHILTKLNSSTSQMRLLRQFFYIIFKSKWKIKKVIDVIKIFKFFLKFTHFSRNIHLHAVDIQGNIITARSYWVIQAKNPEIFRFYQHFAFYVKSIHAWSVCWEIPY